MAYAPFFLVILIGGVIGSWAALVADAASEAKLPGLLILAIIVTSLTLIGCMVFGVLSLRLAGVNQAETAQALGFLAPAAAAVVGSLVGEKILERK